MHVNVTYSTDDYYCCYLDINLSQSYPASPCGGRFGSFLKSSLGIAKLPYNIKLIDLTLEGKFTSDLFVSLPKNYFLNWKNYPEKTADWANKQDAIRDDTGFYDISINTNNESSLCTLGHPYDSSYKMRFVDKFSTQIPSNLESIKHPNDRSFHPYEAYFSYWRAYIIFESLEECKFIDRYLNAEKGSTIFKNTINKIRLSMYSGVLFNQQLNQ